MDKPKFISTPAIIESVGSRKDRSWKVVVGTPEMRPEEGAILMALANQEAYVYFSPKALDEQTLVIPEVAPEFKGEKSPSARLKAALFVLWQQRGKFGDFETFYRTNLDRFIEAVKEKLD